MVPRRKARKRTRSPNRRAFLNVPYDPDYEPLYLAFLAGLCGLGLTPQATLQLPGSQRRLRRILGLIRRCRYSFHDLCRVELDPNPPQTPRFNMPFELGLAVAWEAAAPSSHRWFVFEAVPHRLQKSLSDLGGTDVYIHEYKPSGVLRQLANALSRSTRQPTVKELERIYEDLCEFARSLKGDLRTDSLFEARAFNELVFAAQAIARRRLFGPRAARSPH